MGTWSAAIFGNDTSCDIKDEFFERFNVGEEPEDIKNDIKIFREKGVYPIGKTGRRKADFFLKFANNECIYLSMIKLYRMFM